MEPSKRAQFAASYLLVLLALLQVYRRYGCDSKGARRYCAVLAAVSMIGFLQSKIAQPSVQRARAQALLCFTSMLDKLALQSRSMLGSVYRANSAVVTAASSRVAGLASFANSRVEVARQSIAEAVAGQVDALTNTAVSKISEAVIDPAMPAALKSLIHDTFFRLAPEVRRAILRRANSFFTPPPPARVHSMAEKTPLVEKPRHSVGHASLSIRRPAGAKALGDLLRRFLQHVAQQPLATTARQAQELCTQQWVTFRAFVLYRLAPADKSFWVCCRDPSYWLLSAVGVIPIPWIAYTWWMMIFLMKERTDEYQLVDFIVGFEASKFFAGGCWGLLQGSMRYFFCSSFPGLLPCETVAPRVNALDGLAFVLQIMLVLWAYETLLLLPRPVSRQRNVPKRHDNPDTMGPTAMTSPGPITITNEDFASATWVSPSRLLALVSPSATSSHPPPTVSTRHHPSAFHVAATMFENRGGAIQALFRYHLICVSTCIALTALAVAVDLIRTNFPDRLGCGPSDGCSTMMLPAALYWIRTIYGLLALPYVAFKLPLVTRLYVTSRFTGYSRAGNLVLSATMRPKSQNEGNAAT